MKHIKNKAIDVLYYMEINYLRDGKFLWGMVAMVVLFFIIIASGWEVKAEEEKDVVDIISDKLDTERKVIWCYNKYTKTSQSLSDRKTKGCLQPWDHNIMVMPASHLKEWRSFWLNDRQIINRMPIVNFESGFDIHASNLHAKGYVQTLRKWNIPIDIKSQLGWMLNRQVYQVVEYTPSGSPRCGLYWKQYNSKDGFKAWEEGVMACLYRYHYHAHKGMWYAKKAMSAREVYINYFYNN